MKIKTSDLTGIALDYAVVVIEFGQLYTDQYDLIQIARMWRYSKNWQHAGPIIEREKINTVYHPDINCITGDVFPCWIASIVSHGAEGPTPLIAAMRCYVGSKLGDTVDIPDELIQA